MFHVEHFLLEHNPKRRNPGSIARRLSRRRTEPLDPPPVRMHTPPRNQLVQHDTRSTLSYDHHAPPYFCRTDPSVECNLLDFHDGLYPDPVAPTDSSGAAPPSLLLLIRLFQTGYQMLWLRILVARLRQILATADAAQRSGCNASYRGRAGSERPPSVSTAIVSKGELVQIDLELCPADAMIGADQPLLQVANGAVGERYRRRGSLTERGAQGLGPWDVPESHGAQAREALQAVGCRPSTPALRSA